MKKNGIRAFFILAVIALVVAVFCVATIKPVDKSERNIVVTNFAAYDLARVVFGKNRVQMLITPGVDVHEYEPTASDMMLVANAKMLIYNGGESDDWVNKIIGDADDEEVFRLMDNVELKNEEIVEGMTIEDEEGAEEEDEYDEHVWTSPANMILLLDALAERAKSLGLAVQEDAVRDYREKLQAVDDEIREIVDAAPRKELIFADRFPFRYFVDEFGLDYYAAYPGCATETEPSSATISFLLRKIQEDNVPVILKLELSSNAIADVLSLGTDAEVEEFHAAHNVSQKDYGAGVTYVDLMKRNAEVLRKALY